MARRVFFCFHYLRDIHRIQQIHHSWCSRLDAWAHPIHDATAFEHSKQHAGGVANWIEEQLGGTSVTVVLFGAETYYREWVKHEIKRSHDLGKGILAIDIQGIKDPQHGADLQGLNPLSHWSVKRNGRTLPFTSLYKTYNWVSDGGHENMPAWIEAAATAARR